MQSSSAEFPQVAPSEIDSDQAFVDAHQMQSLDPSILRSTIAEATVADIESTQDIEQVWEELLSIPELQVIATCSSILEKK